MRNRDVSEVSLRYLFAYPSWLGRGPGGWSKGFFSSLLESARAREKEIRGWHRCEKVELIEELIHIGWTWLGTVDICAMMGLCQQLN